MQLRHDKHLPLGSKGSKEYFNATAINSYHMYFVRHSYLACKLCFYHACNPVILVGSDQLPWIVT